MPKNKNKYRVDGKNTQSFEHAAAKAIDLALSSGESVTIEEYDHRGNLLGYVNVRADSEAT
jgi:hypothetical protein